MKNYVSIRLVILAALAASPAAAFDHSPWNSLLKTYVDDQGRVAYRSLAANAESELDGYLAAVAVANTTTMAEKEALAFYLNAYNALVFKGVLDGGDGEGLFARRRFFRVTTYQIAGETFNLEDLENELIRTRFNDARIHFALVCGASSCPFLVRQAYTAENLDELLDRQGRQFLADPTRNPLGPGPSGVRVSRIFKWFREDFERDAGSLGKYLAQWTPPGQPACLTSDSCSFDFVRYDWTLNAQPGERLD